MFKKINLLKLFNLEKIEKQMLYVLVLTALITLNFLISFFSLRVDLSYGKAYTLSSSTKKILKNLDDLVNIKFFVTSDLPTKLLPLKTEAADLLNEYQKESGKVSLKILDPKKDEKAQNEVKEAGIPELQFSQLERDKYAVSTAYFGLIVNYGDKKEVIPQITDVSSLEYNLTSAIYKVTNKEQVKIGIVGKAESLGQAQDDISGFRQIMSTQFVLTPVNIATGEATGIDNSIKMLVVFDDGVKSYTQFEVEELKKYIENGGKALFFIDGIWVAESLTTSQANHNLFSFLEDWGIGINKNLVLSASAELVNFGSGTMSILTPYPFWLKTNNFNFKSSYFSNINQLVFPWVSSLSLSKKDGITSDSLVKTTSKSWEQKENINLNPNEITSPQPQELKEFDIIASAKNKKGGEIVVVPSSRFVLDRFLGRPPTNLEFVLNALNNLASGGVLSGIRSRTIVFYPLPELAESQKDLFKYLNILLLPALLAIFGGIRLMKRR